MNIDITGRHIEITPALREFAADKLGKLSKLLDGPVDAHVVLFIEKHRHVAEIQVKSRRGLFSGQEETGDLYASINEVVDKIEKQIRRSKDKRTARKRRDATRLPQAALAIEAATASPETAEADPAHAEEEPPGRIVRSRRYRLKPLSPEDAAMELESTGEDVLVYRDAMTYRVNVIHRLGDGRFGLVDPEF